jgi:hypothetical protein
MSDEAMNKVLDTLETHQDDPSVFVAGTGVRLKMKRVSQMIIADAKRRLPAPRIPKWFNPDKEREEDNPNDPDYIERVANYQYDTAMLALRIYLIMGTEPMEPLPDGISPHTSFDWSDMILAADPDAEIPETGPRRYYAWLKYYALPDDQVMQCMNKIIRFSGGTLEEDVARAQQSFRRDSERDTNMGVDDSAQSESGPANGIVPWNGAGVRNEGSSSVLQMPVDRLDEPLDLV